MSAATSDKSRLRGPSVLVLGTAPHEPPPGLPDTLSGATYTFAADRDSVRDALAETEVVLFWEGSGERLAEVWPEARALRWVHCAGVGVDRFLFPALVDSDVIVTNCRGVFDKPVAEYTAGVLLAMAKDLRGTIDAQRRREWWHRPVEQLADRHVVVLGAGTIGRSIGRTLRALGMTVELVARTARHDTEFGAIRGADELGDTVPRADYLVLAAPLTALTRGMVGADVLARLRPTARLVNVGRGAVVDEDALLDALRRGRLSGAALDVFTTEPLPPRHPFWEMPNVLVTPHNSGDVHDWLGWFVSRFLENLALWQAGEPLRNVVDKRLGYVPGEGATVI